MSLKTIALAIIASAGGLLSSSAAGVMVNNILAGPVSGGWQGDTLYANLNGTLMNGGSVTMGYFPANVTTADLDTIGKLLARLSSFTMITVAVPGSFSMLSLGSSNPGYVEQADYTHTAIITEDSPLLGRMLYSVITNASGLGEANLASQFALLAIAAFQSDVPLENEYTSAPVGLTPIIGTLGTYTGDAGAGYGVYHTLKMAAIPESSTAMLGFLAALGLVRRRR